MLMKSILTVPGDYQKTLRLRRIIALALLAVGIVAIVCYALLVHQSVLPDFARGFYLGAGSGITLGALLLLGRTQYLLSHPQARKKAQVKEQDERERDILHRAFQFAGLFTFFLMAAALFVVLPLSIAAFNALLGAMVVYFLAFVAASFYFSKTL